MVKIFIILVTINILGCGIAMENRLRSNVLADPNLKPEMRDAIQQGAIQVGMTKQEVMASWGQPCTWCYGTRQSSHGDTWEYNAFGSSYLGAGSGTYLYFDKNGILEYWSK